MTDSFTELRPLLFSIAYRMTGTRTDAEDILQESYLRWQAADRSGIQSPKAFLTTIVSRLSLDS
ncbi:MAG TPA: sigma factor, partial [Bryobacteraceae bacterium]